MGTDIHWVMEMREEAEKPWIGLLPSDLCDVPAGGRFYTFFAEFGVRRSVLDLDEPIDYRPPLADRGLPEDRSALARNYDLVGDHSRTWATLSEFSAAYAKALLAVSDETDHRLMFGPGFQWWYFEAHFECRLIIGFDS